MSIVRALSPAVLLSVASCGSLMNRIIGGGGVFICVLSDDIRGVSFIRGLRGMLYVPKFAVAPGKVSGGDTCMVPPIRA